MPHKKNANGRHHIPKLRYPSANAEQSWTLRVGMLPVATTLGAGFFVSGFEYSEVYGPLARLSYLPGNLRRNLYQARSGLIQRLETASDPA